MPDDILKAPSEQHEPNFDREAVTDESVLASVKRWTKRIRAAREHWQKDFKRMRENMDFVYGIQWAEQTGLRDNRYTANLTLRLITQKVSNLYARNPRFVPKRRRRLDFQLWDGKMESLQQAAALSASPGADQVSLLSARALLTDYTQGRLFRDQVDRVGETLEHVFTYQLASQTPEFKKAMKQLVRRTVITGVGYVRPNFSRDDESVLSTSDNETTVMDRARAAREILGRLEEGTLEMDSPEVQKLRELMTSIAMAQIVPEETGPSERLLFEFPTSTSVIPDPACRALKDFVGAKWVVQEYIKPLSEVNAFFETQIKPGGDVVRYNEGGESSLETLPDSAAGCDEPFVAIWEVFDLTTKSTFFLCDGWKEYVKSPEPVYPRFKRFWPIFALTFNDTEVEPGQTKATVFPPSDVDLLISPQKEWNRSRESLRQHRRANEPKYITGRGWLTERDKESLLAAEPNAVIELDGVQPNSDVSKLLAPFQHAPIDPSVYDTSPLNQDMFMSVGNEEGVQPASSKGTATAATINEQARIITTSSNVDDLDDLLSDLAEACGEILLREMSMETAKRIAGPGAAWPEEDPEEFVNYIFLEVVASSSGRPNKSLEIANFQQLAPTLIAAGANPQFIVREAVKRLDDRLDLDEAFPMGASVGVMGPPNSNPPVSTNPPRGVVAPSRTNTAPSGVNPRPQGQTADII